MCALSELHVYLINPPVAWWMHNREVTPTMCAQISVMHGWASQHENLCNDGSDGGLRIGVRLGEQKHCSNSVLRCRLVQAPDAFPSV